MCLQLQSIQHCCRTNCKTPGASVCAWHLPLPNRRTDRDLSSLPPHTHTHTHKGILLVPLYQGASPGWAVASTSFLLKHTPMRAQTKPCLYIRSITAYHGEAVLCLTTMYVWPTRPLTSICTSLSLSGLPFVKYRPQHLLIERWAK